MDERQRQWNNATRLELRRLVSHARPPSDKPLKEFGPWARYVEPLRAAHSGGTARVRELFITLDSTTPDLGRLLSSDLEDEPVIWTTAELLALELEPLRWIVPDLLPAGLATLAGRPKLGKSWLAMQIAIAAGTGGQIFGRPVERIKVLYIALEEGERRAQDRIHKLGATPNCGVSWTVSWPLLTGDGLDRLEAVVHRDGYQLIVIDTLSRALGFTDQLDMSAMNVHIGNLHDLSNDTGTAILTVDHHKKPTGFAGGDPIDDILGSTAKSAIVDIAIGIYRERGRQEATLKATGRDMLDVALALTWDAHACRWHCVGEAGQVQQDSVRAQILDAIRELDDMGEVASTTNIARHLGADKGNISRELADLLHIGKIVKGEKQGRLVPYHLVGPDEPTPESSHAPASGDGAPAAADS